LHCAHAFLPIDPMQLPVAHRPQTQETRKRLERGPSSFVVFFCEPTRTVSELRLPTIIRAFGSIRSALFVLPALFPLYFLVVLPFGGQTLRCHASIVYSAKVFSAPLSLWSCFPLFRRTAQPQNERIENRLGTPGGNLGGCQSLTVHNGEHGSTRPESSESVQGGV
jgi:hypothetical protein